MCVRAQMPDLSDSDSGSDDEAQPQQVPLPPEAQLLNRGRAVQARLVQRTAPVPPAARPQRRRHRRGEPAVRPRAPIAPPP